MPSPVVPRLLGSCDERPIERHVAAGVARRDAEVVLAQEIETRFDGVGAHHFRKSVGHLDNAQVIPVGPEVLRAHLRVVSRREERQPGIVGAPCPLRNPLNAQLLVVIDPRPARPAGCSFANSPAAAHSSWKATEWNSDSPRRYSIAD